MPSKLVVPRGREGGREEKTNKQIACPNLARSQNPLVYPIFMELQVLIILLAVLL
jgi:hypothetical protein